VSDQTPHLQCSCHRAPTTNGEDSIIHLIYQVLIIRAVSQQHPTRDAHAFSWFPINFTIYLINAINSLQMKKILFYNSYYHQHLLYNYFNNKHYTLTIIIININISITIKNNLYSSFQKKNILENNDRSQIFYGTRDSRCHGINAVEVHLASLQISLSSVLEYIWIKFSIKIKKIEIKFFINLN